MNEYEKFGEALDNLGRVISEELGLYKLLDKLTEWLVKWSKK